MTLFERLKNDLRRPAITYQDNRRFESSADKLHAAAVLVPVTDRPEPGVILTQRPVWLPRHAGQVAFPGGRMDDDDETLVFTALREAEEEIGLAPDVVNIAGVGASYYSGSGFEVTPVVGVIPADYDFRPDPGEVDDIFEVPLSILLGLGKAEPRKAMWQGIEREYFELQWNERRIWGVTAGILHNLSRQLEWDLG